MFSRGLNFIEDILFWSFRFLLKNPSDLYYEQSCKVVWPWIRYASYIIRVRKHYNNPCTGKDNQGYSLSKNDILAWKNNQYFRRMLSHRIWICQNTSAVFADTLLSTTFSQTHMVYQIVFVDLFTLVHHR